MIENICYIVLSIILVVIAHIIIWKESKRRYKVSLRFEGAQNDEDEILFNKLLAAVLENYPQLVKIPNNGAELEVKDEVVYLAIIKGSEEEIDLDHVVEHLRYCLHSIAEDPPKCIKLMRSAPGPNFEANLSKLRLSDSNNARLNIFSETQVRTNTNLVIWPQEYNRQQWMTQFQSVNSVIHTVKHYKDVIQMKGLDGLTKTTRENIRRMMALHQITEGDGLYLVRKSSIVGQYAHVAVVTDTQKMNLVHATPNFPLPFFWRELGKIVEEMFERVVKLKDECFVVRYQKEELTGQEIANRAKTFVKEPALTFTYSVIDANCEVVLNAAAGIFREGLGSLQGQLVRDPYSDPWKKMFGWLLGCLQKSSEADLLYQMHFKLYKHDMLYRGESQPGQEQVSEYRHTFTSKLKGQNVVEHDRCEFEIDCEADDAEVSWYRDGKKITPEDGRVEIVIEGKKRKLVFKDTHSEDAGEINCKTNRDSSSCILKVAYANGFIKGLDQFVDVVEREQYVFNVEVKDHGAPVDFFINGKKVSKSDSRCEYQNLGEGKHQLVIHNIKMEDMGTVEAKTPSNRGDQVLTSSTAFDVTKGEEAPEIGETGPVTGVAYKECNWKIPYKITGHQHSPLEVIIIKDGKELKIGQDINLSIKGDSVDLSVINPRREKSGTYKVIFRNAQGQDERDINVNIMGPSPQPAYQPTATDLTRITTLKDGRLDKPTLADLDFLATLPSIPPLTYICLCDINLSAMEVHKLCRILSSCSGKLYLISVTLPAATWPTLAASSYALTKLGIRDMSIGEDAAYMGCVAGASTEVALQSVTMAWDAWARGISGALRQGGRCNEIQFWGNTATKYGASITALGITLGWKRTYDSGIWIRLERK